MPQDHEFHPITNIWPLMSKDEFAGLVTSISERGLQVAIWLHPDDDTIIDGRNRYLACKEAGVTPRFHTWNGEGSLIEFVMDLNEHRRHLSASQRATAAAKIKAYIAAEMKANRGANISKGMQRASDTKQSGGDNIVTTPEKDRNTARSQAAKAAHVSPGYVDRAEAIIKKAPEVAEKVARGELSIPAGERQAGITKPGIRQNVSKYKPPGAATKPAPEPAVVSTGKSRVNGQLVADSPEIAKLRASGKIHKDAVVDVDEPDEPEMIDDVIEEKREEQAIREDQDSDEAWAASLPLAKKLKDRQLAIFLEDAINWRRLKRERERFGHAIAERLNKTKRKGPWLKKMRWLMTIGDPSKWILCPAPDIGEGAGCGGVGRIMGMPCTRCHQNGYWING